MTRFLPPLAASLLLFLACLGAVLPAPALAMAPASTADADPAVTSALQEVLSEDTSLVDGHSVDLDALRRLYGTHNNQPIWVSHQERIGALQAALAAAQEDGLDFPAPAALPARPSPDRLARQDLLFSDLALRLASSLATGRVRPESWEEDWAVPAPSFDPIAGLDAAINGGKLAEWLASLAPRDPRYLALKAALGRYRGLAAQGAWPTIPAGPTIKPGMSDSRILLIRQRLIAEGYLPADATGDSVFDGVVMLGIADFQQNHGITGDGAIGARTIAALNVSLRKRIEQIALNLERWRSLPRDFGRNNAFVNVPAQTLEVFEDGTPVLSMRVVVGDPARPTPVVLSRIQAITFNPVWRVPTSIALKEILPKIRADRRFLAKNDMVQKGAASFEQLPGPKNPLGRIKFETPNKFDVYLHDTPTRTTFERAARAVSHGCVRLEDAHSLALYLLQDAKVPQSTWTPEALQQAVDTGLTEQVEPSRHLRVAILYFTSFVGADGTVEFRDDLYGRDKRLAAALQAVGSSPPLSIHQNPPSAANPPAGSAGSTKTQAGADGITNLVKSASRTPL